MAFALILAWWSSLLTGKPLAIDCRSFQERKDATHTHFPVLPASEPKE